MPKTVTCPECGETFTCDPEGPCWCKSYPPVKIPEELRGRTCLCRCVLDRLRREEQAATEHAEDRAPDSSR